jgi:nucleotide-binding universal stress UspA family protein
MFANILVPLDGSVLSERALALAHDLTRASSTTLHLLQVIALPSELDALRGSGGESVTVLEMARDAAQRLRDAQTAHGQAYLAGLAGPLQQAGLQVTTALREGAADEQIVAYAQEQAIDLIVMSTHGHSGLKRFFLGSVTDRVIRAGQTPVLVVPAS